MTDQTIPQLRAWDGMHGAPDSADPDRLRLVRERWSGQDAALLARDKTVEENCRMLAGRQWDVWVPTLGQFVDPLRFLTDSEKRWRQRPVVNILAKWFLLTHARLTENTPSIGFQPATADRMDQMLAETMEVVFRTLWEGELNMDQRMADLTAWLIAAGEVYVETGVEYRPSAARYQLTAPATLSLTADDGSTIERETAGPVPYSADGEPLAALQPDGEDYGYAPQEGQPAEVAEGTPCLRVYSPLEVRAEWGANVAWEDRQWIIVRRYLTPAMVQTLYGVTVPPDHAGAGDLSGTAGSLTRILFGTGNFGAVTGNGLADQALTDTKDGFVTVDTMWEKPSAASPASDGHPGGRLLIVTPNTVLHDSIRPYETKAAGPIRRAQFVQMPGRAGFGSTPLEPMVPLQKTYNRGWAQILEHRNRTTNPILLYDANSGFADQAENVPGAMVAVDFALTQGKPPAAYLAPPALSGDVYKIQQMLLEMLMTMGSMAGAEGEAPTEDPSGELISQLRFNADRPIGVAARSIAMLLAGVADDLVAVLPVCWPAEKIITYAGEDSVLRTTQILPEMWEGRVNVKPDLSNALGETQEAKRARLFRDWQAGAYGDPTTEGAKKYLEQVGHPSSDRTAVIGGVDRITCERFLNAIGQGAPAAQIPMLPWYNYDVFLETTRNHLAAPEYLDYDPAIQQQFAQLFEMILNARALSARMQAQAQAPVVAAQAALQGHAESALAAHAPSPPDASSDAAGGAPTGPKHGPDATSAGPSSGAKAA